MPHQYLEYPSPYFQYPWPSKQHGISYKTQSNIVTYLTWCLAYFSHRECYPVITLSPSVRKEISIRNNLYHRPQLQVPKLHDHVDHTNRIPLHNPVYG